jgi:hypothetical protein
MGTITFAQRLSALEKNQRVANGVLANTNIAVSGILATDELVTVFALSDTQSLVEILGIDVLATSFPASSDITSICSITSNGNIQCSSSTLNKILIVTWKS